MTMRQYLIPRTRNELPANQRPWFCHSDAPCCPQLSPHPFPFPPSPFVTCCFILAPQGGARVEGSRLCSSHVSPAPNCGCRIMLATTTMMLTNILTLRGPRRLTCAVAGLFATVRGCVSTHRGSSVSAAATAGHHSGPHSPLARVSHRQHCSLHTSNGRTRDVNQLLMFSCRRPLSITSRSSPANADHRAALGRIPHASEVWPFNF